MKALWGVRKSDFVVLPKFAFDFLFWLKSLPTQLLMLSQRRLICFFLNPLLPVSQGGPVIRKSKQ